jgi:stress response protein YsnF
MTSASPDPHRLDPADPVELIRSEERLVVTTEAVPVRRAVLRVETTTEEVMVPVTLTRQHVRLEYVDVEPADAVPVPTERLLDGAVGDWLVLTADEPVVGTRPVPTERVRLVTSWVSAEQQIQVELAHEDVSVDTTDLPPQTTGTSTG